MVFDLALKLLVSAAPLGRGDDENDQPLALGWVHDPDGRSLAHRVEREEDFLDLRRAQALAGDFDRVVGAAENVEEPLFIMQREITVDPLARARAPVGIQVALVVVPEGLRHPDERRPDRQLADRSDQRVALVVDHIGRHRGAGRVERRGGDGLDDDAREQRAGGLGAPGHIDHRAGAAAEVLLEPLKVHGVDRLASSDEYPNR